MEKTLQTQYNLIKEGKGDKAYFLKSAYRLFPDMLSPVNTFEDTTRILKNRGIISEGIGGVVTSGKKQDWHAIFNENMDKLKEEERTQAGLGLYLMFDKKTGKLESFMDTHNHKEDDNLKKQIENKGQYVLHFVKGSDYNKFKDSFNEFKGKTRQELGLFNDDEMKMGAQAVDMLRGATISTMRESKEPSKEVLDNQKHNFDYKDEKNYDNLFGEEFLKGYYTEMKDPKNTDKDVEELRAIVAKNLAKDISYYVKNGQFGVKGLGYTTEAPGLGEPKPAKGKHAPSGYGDIPKYTELKESVLRLVIQDLIKEALTEGVEKLLQVGQYGTYDGQPVEIIKVNDMRVYPYATYDIKDADDKITKNVDIDKVTSKEQEAKKTVSESLDRDSIKEEGEKAKKDAIKKRIDREKIMRKKKIKALETLTELEDGEDNDNAKKIKELQSEIKQLEGMAAKLDDKKKVKETTVVSPGTSKSKANQIAKDEGATTDAVNIAIDDANQTNKPTKVVGKGQ